MKNVIKRLATTWRTWVTMTPAPSWSSSGILRRPCRRFQISNKLWSPTWRQDSGSPRRRSLDNSGHHMVANLRRKDLAKEREKGEEKQASSIELLGLTARCAERKDIGKPSVPTVRRSRSTLQYPLRLTRTSTTCRSTT